jgi:hypothetical protein
MKLLPAPFTVLTDYPQFILWRAVWDDARGKFQKIPTHPGTGNPHSAHDSTQWMDAGTALNELQNKPDDYGIGFVFTDNDPFWFLDIDNCAASGRWSPLALELLNVLHGAAVEVSYSGSGLHIFGAGKIKNHACKNIPLGLEFYTSGRFVALSMNQVSGNMLTDFTDIINDVVIPRFFPASEHAQAAEWSTGPVEEWNGPTDDDELINKILSSKKSAGAVFGKRAAFPDLWFGNSEALGQAYPAQAPGADFDHSAADSALCTALAFWTGKDCERIDRLFRKSALYREKWERERYREDTILKAVSITKNVYSKPEKREYSENDSVIPHNPAHSEDIQHREGLQYLAPAAQEQLFAGCVYVSSVHRVWLPSGAMLRSEQFKVHFGGYIFALDSINDKVTRNAWEAFTESQAIRFKRVDSTCFRPELPPGAIIYEEGNTLVNVYVPAKISCAPGDPAPFLHHLKLLFPDETDREIITSYMAAIVQYPGVKFQWAPLVQGCEGNGKTLLIKCVTAAIGGLYSHYPNASDLGGNGAKFNSWLQNKLFIGIEEIYTSDKREVADAMKPLISNDRIEFQGKGVDQVTGDNRANFILCSNHKDAIRKHDTDRRYCILYTAQQEKSDLFRAGMTLADGTTPTNYFPALWAWLKTGGYSVVTYYLKNYQISDKYNPATLCVRAPTTSSTSEALELGVGQVEQEILECIDQGVYGFKGGWVSSLMLTRLLENLRKARSIPPSKRAELMYSLGYIKHPGLMAGRVNSTIPAEGGKPRLYVKNGSIQCNIEGAKQIQDAYMKAQEHNYNETAEQVFK